MGRKLARLPLDPRLGRMILEAGRQGCAGEVLISADLHQWIWSLVQSEPVTVKTKHEGDWPAIRIKAIRSK